MPDSQQDLLERYLPWKRPVEIGFWVLWMLLGATLNSFVVLLDVQRAHLDFAAWQPVTWEWSSGLSMLALVPGLSGVIVNVPSRLKAAPGPGE